MQMQVHFSTAHRQDRVSLHPNGTPSPRSSLDRVEGASASRFHSALLPQRGSGPKTGARACQGCAQVPPRPARSNPLRESVPKLRVRAAFGRNDELTVAQLRRPPAGNPVKWETTAEQAWARRRLRQTLSRTRRNWCWTARTEVPVRPAPTKDPTGRREEAPGTRLRVREQLLVS